MKAKKTQTRNRKGAKPIVDALFQMAKVPSNDTFQRKLARYTRIISELDYGQTISVDELEASDYEEFKKIMLHMAEQYDISNLEKWCSIKKSSDLYRIEEEGQIHFYEETRSFFMALHRRDHGEARKAYARINEIPAPSSQLNRKELRMHEIYTYIKHELFKPKLTNPKDRGAKTATFSKMDIVALHQKEKELQQQLRQSEQDAKAYPEAECRQESILTELLELYADLLSRSHSDDTRQHYQTERRTYRNKLEALKAKKYQLLYSNPEMLHIKLNLLEGTSETQFTEMDPTQEKQNRIYERCRKEFDRRASELLDSIIEQVTQEVTKELEQEAKQQEKE